MQLEGPQSSRSCPEKALTGAVWPFRAPEHGHGAGRGSFAPEQQAPLLPVCARSTPFAKAVRHAQYSTHCCSSPLKRLRRDACSTSTAQKVQAFVLVLCGLCPDCGANTDPSLPTVCELSVVQGSQACRAEA